MSRLMIDDNNNYTLGEFVVHINHITCIPRTYFANDHTMRVSHLECCVFYHTANLIQRRVLNAQKIYATDESAAKAQICLPKVLNSSSC